MWYNGVYKLLLGGRNMKLGQCDMRFEFPYRNVIKPRWRPTVEELIKFFEAKKQRATRLDVFQENERVLMFLNEVRTSSALVYTLDNVERKEELKKEHSIEFVLGFKTPEDLQNFNQEYQEKIIEGKVL